MECEFEGCGRPRLTRGLCSGHYQQLRSGRELAPLRHRGKNGAQSKCSFDGCDQPTRAHGLCGTHNQQRYNNRPLTAINRNNKKPEGMDVAQYFWTLVDMDTNAPCWLWQGGKASAGYGVFYADGDRHSAHRWAYEQVNGPIPANTRTNRECGVSECVNPEHLGITLAWKERAAW